MSKILRYLACLFMLIFAGNALAAGYSCPSYKKYTSCASGYYMTSSSSSTTCNTTAKAGNACRPCSVMGSDYTCAGGTSCPKLNEVTITYNLNGGSGTTPSSKKCTPGTSCSLASGATTSFYRAGYVFKGWSTSSTATSGSTSITFNANDTVYAVWSACAAGTYKAGSGTQASASCSACSGRTKYQNLTGQSSCKTVSSGYYTTGCNSSGNNCTNQSQCTGATYCSGGVQNSCPAQTSGWTRNSGTGWTSYTQCNQTRAASSVSSYCISGTLKQNATSATAWGATTVSTALSAKAGAYVNGTTCTQCQAGYACPGGTSGRSACSGSLQYQNAVGQTSCKTVSDGYYKSSNSAQTQCPANYRDGTGAANINACKTSCAGGTYVATAEAACTSVGTGYYRAAHTVNYGSTSTRSQCPSGYRDGAATSAQSGCKMDVEAGHYVGTANSATQATCAAGTYKAAHTITYGSTSSCSACSGRTKYSAAGASACKTVSSGYYTTGCNTSGNNCTGQSQCTGATYCSSGVQNNCPSGYTANTTAGKTAASSCQISCSGGTYVATANAACTSVGTGYYRAAHTVNYGSTSTRTQCPANYRSGAAASSESGCQTSCAGGTYVATAEAACTAVGDGYYRAAHSVSYGSTSTRNTCPSGYPNSDAGAAAITSCYSNSKSRAWTGSQVNGSVPNNCSAVTEWGTCSGSACTYVAYANSAGTGDGTIKSGCSTNNANCTKPVKAVSAKAGYYDNGTSCSACPTGYPNSDAGNEGGITKCYSDEKSRPWSGSQTACTKPTGCYEVTCNSCSNPACSYVAYANSAGTGDGTIKSGCSTNNASCTQTVNTVTANAGRYVSGKTCPACAVGTFQGSNDSTATSCSVCSGNTYAASTGMSSCSACPSGYTISGTAAANHDAKSDCSITCAAGTRVVTADAACTTPTGSWYTASHSVTAGSTTPAATVKACLTNYSTPNTTTRTDHDASTDCKISCAAGTRITAANATSCTTPAGNWYVGAHSVAQGSVSSYSNCLTNYTISGTAAANHDTASDCKISCGGGSYIATANNTTCSDVGAGYWAAASTVSQGSAGVRNACDDGLTTIGSGAGADEVGDCGRVLNVNGEKIYLRSERKTTPSLNVSINGTTFYGNMGASGIGALKLNSGGTTYSVYDDSME